MWGSGTIYFDDVDFEAIKAKELIPVSTDQEFYYTGDTTGTLNVILDTYSVRLNPSSTNTSNNIHSDTSLNIDVPAAYTINFTTNAATKELQIYFSMDTSANGNAWLDDVSLIKN